MTIPGGINVLGAGKDRTLLDLPDIVTDYRCTMFSVNGLNGLPVRISGIGFLGRVAMPSGDTAIKIASCKDFRVDHSSFRYLGGAGVAVNDADVIYSYPKDFSKVSQGVVDHCDFIDLYKPEADPHISPTPEIGSYAYGVSVARSYHYDWTPWEDRWNLFGKYLRNTFIEDSYFSGCRHALQATWAGAYVARHCIIEDIKSKPWPEAATTGHPVREGVYGMLSAEIYDCIIRKTGTEDLLNSGNFMFGIHHESGSGLYYHNTIQQCYDGIQVGNVESITMPYWQEGQTLETYIWENYPSGNVNDIVIQGSVAGPPQEDVNFFLNPPPAARDYTAYPYPHPLTQGATYKTLAVNSYPQGVPFNVRRVG